MIILLMPKARPWITDALFCVNENPAIVAGFKGG